MTRHNGPRLLGQHRAREMFVRKLEQLRFELRVQAPRRVLDYLLEHLDDLLEHLDGTTEQASYRRLLAEIRVAVARRSNLKVVQ